MIIKDLSFRQLIKSIIITFYYDKNEKYYQKFEIHILFYNLPS